MTLFDTHCHLQDPAFNDIDGVVERAAAAGVDRMLVCGYDLASSEAAVAMCASRPALLPAAGVHPHDARDVTAIVADRIEALVRDARVVAVGEIGLDFYRDLSPRRDQQNVLDMQLAFAVAAGKPVSVHSRGAEEEIYGHLRDYAAKSPLATSGRPVGVMHCFGGSIAQAQRYVDLGFLVSIPCSVTYPNNESGRRVARELPLESLVVETDSPYLPPQSRRGKRNEPAFVTAAAQALAELRDIDVAEVIATTSSNAERAFGVATRAEAAAL